MIKLLIIQYLAKRFSITFIYLKFTKHTVIKKKLLISYIVLKMRKWFENCIPNLSIFFQTIKKMKKKSLFTVICGLLKSAKEYHGIKGE